jgi:signal transduction histidine kinase
MQQPSLDVLKYRAMPELSRALRAAEAEILRQWRGKVQELLPAADELTMQQLEDHLPVLIDKIAAALAASHPKPTNELIEVSPVHGETRFHQHFNLNELLIEYHILRQVMIEIVTDQLDRELEVQEAIALNVGIDTALRRSVIAFSEHQATELKSEANALTKYLSFLSHDLRGSLNGAVLMIEVLKRELEGESKFQESIEDLDAMRRGMLDTVATMDRFLHAERLRRGKMPVKLAPVNLKKLLNEVARAFAYEAEQRKTTLNVQAPENCIEVSDRDLITLIVQNLVSNALKYGRDGVTVVADPDHGGCARISVIDNGPGISPEKLHLLFAPFTRGETYGQPGIGLGLSIARQAADLLGARLWAESEPGKGTSFHLELKK